MIFFNLTSLFFFAAIASAEQATHIANPGTGVCREEWIRSVQNNFSVRFDREYLDANGNVIPSPNPRPFCSGSLVRVGPENRLKIVSAAHCASEKNRNAPNGQYHFTENDIPPGAPPNARSARIVARIAGREPAIPITNFNGPSLQADPRNATESWRRDDFVVMDSQSVDLETLVTGKRVPTLCNPSMERSSVDRAAVVGFGTTNNNDPSLTPLCGEQNINTIDRGIITIAPYVPDTSGACPGDSGGGLWVKPKGSSTACLAGAVSGPRATSHSAPPQTGTPPPPPPSEEERRGAALRSCTTPGVEAIFSSVYQANLDPYIHSLRPPRGEPLNRTEEVIH